MVREIPLTQGAVALVDDEDYERASTFRWGLLIASPRHRYARRATNRGGVFRNILMHRFLMDAPDGVDVDHIDSDGLNCQRSNMRLATTQQNVWNSRKNSNSMSEFKGLHTIDGGESWIAEIGTGKDRIRLGRYMDAEQAARVYDAAVTHVRGEFAWTNFPELEQWAVDLARRLLNGARLPRKPHSLSDEDVIRIRTAYANGGVYLRELAEDYGVTVGAIGHAINGRTFGHITDPAPLTHDKRRKAA